MNIKRVVSDKPKNYLRIEFMVSNVCNYKCWYCGPHANAGDFKWTNNLPLLIGNFKHLIEYYKSNGKTEFELTMLGGEPTLWRDLKRFVTEIKEDTQLRLIMTTNASRTIRWWKEHAPLFDKIQFSYHPSYANQKHYIEVVDTVYELGISCNALIEMDPKNWNVSMEMIEKCKKESKYPWSISAMEIHSEIEYTDSQKEFFKNHIKRYPDIERILRDEKHNMNRPKPRVIFEDNSELEIKRNWISVNNLNNFKGWICDLGIENINIQKDGIITGTCGEKLFGLDFYFNIYDENFKDTFKPILKPVVCSKSKCFCQPEMLMNKFKP